VACQGSLAMKTCPFLGFLRRHHNEVVREMDEYSSNHPIALDDFGATFPPHQTFFFSVGLQVIRPRPRRFLLVVPRSLTGPMTTTTTMVNVNRIVLVLPPPHVEEGLDAVRRGQVHGVPLPVTQTGQVGQGGKHHDDDYPEYCTYGGMPVLPRKRKRKKCHEQKRHGSRG
jgi:hypothetical protein